MAITEQHFWGETQVISKARYPWLAAWQHFHYVGVWHVIWTCMLVSNMVLYDDMLYGPGLLPLMQYVWY
jgi:hypothetical protein